MKKDKCCRIILNKLHNIIMHGHSIPFFYGGIIIFYNLTFMYYINYNLL